MSSTFERLNLRNQKQIVVLSAPESFEDELSKLRGVTILRDLQDRNEIEFSLAFITKEKEVETLGKAIAKKAKGDAVIWFAYPKGTSKNTKARSTAITAGEFSASLDSKASGALLSMRIRRLAVFDEWNLSNR